jgi:hypothetical protein
MHELLQLIRPTKQVEHIYFSHKVKVKFALEQATKAQRGSRDTALLFL